MAKRQEVSRLLIVVTRIASVLIASLFVATSFAMIAEQSHDYLELSPRSSPVPSDNIYDIIMMGNSYTYVNDLPLRLDRAMDASGTKTNIHELTGGGMQLAEHADKTEDTGDRWYSTVTETEGLDWVILQDQSQIPSFRPLHSDWQNSKDGAIRIAEVVDETDSDLMFFMTWGRKNGDSQNSARNPDFLTMQDNLESGYNLFAENVSDEDRTAWIAPVGLAWKHIYLEERDSGGTPEDDGNKFSNLYAADGSHPSETGTYLSSCVLMSSITGEKCAGMHTGLDIDKETLLFLQQAADDTVFNETKGYDYPWQNGSVEPVESQLSIRNSDYNEGLPGAEVRIQHTIRNEANQDEVARLYLISNDGWVVEWDEDISSESGPITREISAGGSLLVYSVVTIPKLEGNQPAAGSFGNFTLMVESSIDNSEIFSQWQVEVLAVRSVNLLSESANITVVPGQTDSIEIEVENTGNTLSGSAITMIPVDAEGEPLDSYYSSQSFEIGDWQVEIDDTNLSAQVDAGSSTLHKIEWNTPLAAEGSLSFRIEVKPYLDAEESQYLFVNLTIESEAEIEMAFLGECLTIEGDSPCTSYFRVQNSGDVSISLSLSVEVNTWWLGAVLNQTNIVVGPNENTSIKVDLSASEALGGDVGNYVVTVMNSAGDSLLVVERQVMMELITGWEFLGVSDQSMLESDEITLGIVVRNIGNLADTINIQLSSSDADNMSLSYQGMTLSTQYESREVEPGQSFIIQLIVSKSNPTTTDQNHSATLSFRWGNSDDVRFSHSEWFPTPTAKEEADDAEPVVSNNDNGILDDILSSAQGNETRIGGVALLALLLIGAAIFIFRR